MGSINDVLQHPSAQLTQHLSLSIGTVNAPFDVLNARLEEGFNETYAADITVTSSEMAIDGAACVGRRATFTIDEEAAIPSIPGLVAPVVVPAKIVHGVVTQWERVKASRDEAIYRLRIEPRIALLDQVHDSGVFQNTSLKKLISDLIVDRKLFDSFDIEFALEDANEQFEQTVMYEESVLNFISRHCRRAGVFWYFKQGKRGDAPLRDTIVFGDNPLPTSGRWNCR
jgi:type VI secretion system secreted protein VgrG